MKKRFCDACGGEVEQVLGITVVRLEQWIAAITIHQKEEGEPALNLCRPCVVEAIGKIYIESEQGRLACKDRLLTQDGPWTESRSSMPDNGYINPGKQSSGPS